MTRLIPAVEVELFEKAFAVWHHAIIAAPPEEHFEAGMFSLFHMLSDDKETFKAVSGRMMMFGDMLSARKDEIKKFDGFPSTWIQVAATAPLQRLKDFDPSLFPWPTGEALKAFEAEAAEGRASSGT